MVYFGDEHGEGELLSALTDGAIDAIARGEIDNSSAALESGGELVVTALDPASEHGGFTVSADDPELLSCLDDKIEYLTDQRNIGFAEWRDDPSVFMRRARAWSDTRDATGH